jgi:hypothetical protein
LVVRGSTRQFNPTFDQAVIDKDLAKDAQLYGAEYLSEWRDDLATFLSREMIDGCVESGATVRPPQSDISYRAFCDSSGGASDSFTASIAHREHRGDSERIVIDCLYERRAPFNPSEVIADIARLLQTYRIAEVTGDRYAEGFVVDGFAKHGITYRRSRLDRSQVYLNFLPLVTSGTVSLLDHARTISQFAGLERRTFPSGKDKVDHAKGAHDDLANATAGAAVLAAHREPEVVLTGPLIVGSDGEFVDAGAAASPQRVDATKAFYEWNGHGGGFDMSPGLSWSRQR